MTETVSVKVVVRRYKTDLGKVRCEKIFSTGRGSRVCIFTEDISKFSIRTNLYSVGMETGIGTIERDLDYDHPVQQAGYSAVFGEMPAERKRELYHRLFGERLQ